MRHWSRKTWTHLLGKDCLVRRFVDWRCATILPPSHRVDEAWTRTQPRLQDVHNQVKQQEAPPRATRAYVLICADINNTRRGGAFTSPPI